MLRNKVAGGGGEISSYGDTANIRQKVRKWNNEILCIFHLQRTNWNWVFNKRWEEKNHTFCKKKKKSWNFKSNKFISLEKSDFCKVHSYLDSVFRIRKILINLVQHNRDRIGATHYDWLPYLYKNLEGVLLPKL